MRYYFSICGETLGPATSSVFRRASKTRITNLRAEALGYSVLPFHGRSSRSGASQSFSDAVLQFRGDHLLEFDDISREFADTFRQFLGGHRFLVERETERFLVE